jgi:hypothetical protein
MDEIIVLRDLSENSDALMWTRFNWMKVSFNVGTFVNTVMDSFDESVTGNLLLN